jgi:hypothetical protein
MNLVKLPFISGHLREELKIRLNLGIFIILTNQLSNVIFAPINEGGLMLVIYSLIEISLIGIVLRFCGERNVAKDFNELNFYSLLVHMTAIPGYYLYASMTYHNYTIKFFFYVYLVRLIYFGPITADGDYRRFPVFGFLSVLRKFRSVFGQVSSKKAFDYLPSLLFFGSALPLWFIMWRTNDPTVTVTTIGLMAYIFIISNRIHNGGKIKSAESANRVVNLPNEVAEATRVITEQLNDAKFIIQRLKEICKALGVLALGVVIFGFVVLEAKNESKFNLGYYFGYDDALRKVAPRMKADWKTLKDCYLETDYHRGSSIECIELEENTMESK